MKCPNRMLYTIEYGDNLYDIALRFNTTVEDIKAINMHLNPYNLIVGTQIVVCPNTRETEVKPNTGISPENLKIMEEMNMLWEQHVFWNRLLLISIAENLRDVDFTRKRLLRNPMDIANLYRGFYGGNIANRMSELLTEHLVIGEKIIVALKEGNSEQATELSKDWHKNADDISEFFASFNPFYNKEEIRKMFYNHLRLTTDEVEARIRKDYEADIAAFDKVEQEALEMARYFSAGIIKQATH